MKIKYFDKAIEWIFLSMVFLLPVIFDRRIGIVFSGTKSASIRLFILLILSIWAIKLLISRKPVFFRSILDWPILSYILVASAATILAVNPIISFSGFYGRYEGLVTWVSYAFMFFIAIYYIRGFEKLKQLIAVVATTATTMAIYGIIQRSGIDPYVWGGVVTWQRVIATIGQPNFLSAYVGMAFFLLMYFLLTTNKPIEMNIIEKFTHSKTKSITKDSHDFITQFTPILYYLLVPFLFIIMIYSQTGLNIFLWYSFFIAMTVSALFFTYNYNKIPDFALKILFGVSIVLIYICNFYTQSRGGTMALGVGLVLILVLIPRKRLLDNWKVLFALGLAIVAVTVITSLDPKVSSLSRFGQEIKAGGGDEHVQPGAKDAQNTVELGGAAGSRGETWKSAAGIIADNPIFGIGPEDLKMVFPRYETNLFRFKEAFHVKQDRCHNETFDVPVTKGLLAFFVYISILFMVFRHGIQKLKSVDDDKKVMIAVTIAALATYLIQNQFSFGVIAITSLFWVLWAIIINIDSTQQEEDKKGFTFDDVPWIPVGIIIIVFFFLGYLSIQQFEADKQFKTGKTYMDMQRFADAIPLLRSSLDWFPYEGGTATHYGIALLNNALRLPPQDQRKNLDEALKAFAYGMKIDPLNADNLYISSRIYLMTGNIPSAIDFTNKALKIDPYYAEAYLTLASIAEKNGNVAEAQKAYNEAYRINPNLSESKLRVAQDLIAQGKFDDAFNILQSMLVTDPKNPAVHIGLGTIYQKRNQQERAKEEFELAKTLMKK